MNSETLGEICFPSTPETASLAREKVCEWLGRDHSAYENARLAVSELVTNAVRHAGGEPDGEPGGKDSATAAGPEGGGGSASFDSFATVDGPWDVDGAGAGALVLRLTAHGGSLRVEVVDRGWSTGEPRVLRADPGDEPEESGRGLAIVSALSDGNWGYRSHGPGLGRTVWCEIPAGPSPSEDSRAAPSGSHQQDLPRTSARLAWPEHGDLSTRVWWHPPRSG
ncbi:ATP-binding protein [Streptosporangium carneum]|uniref:ATP-binding protein n=1 Tax=Streptosporangium carneum TaxID=47481 RepID=A0A9W6ME59_9ACTN|nr:ATP-binding protein [Streptosporangium carneum]GLK11214.1 hypothetical protein GCM10017600_46200 [Streptosporangium carneum]